MALNQIITVLQFQYFIVIAQPELESVSAKLPMKTTLLKKIIKKRKNWSAPGADGIQNYWWKKFNVTWRPVINVFKEMIDNPTSIREWFTIGMTILLPKTKDLEQVSEYRPITCLNTIYKIFTGLIANHMKEHVIDNDLWDRCQLGTQGDVLGTTDQLLIDNCILEEVKEHRRNLAVSYYDYKKAYDRVYHDWMLMVFEWMGVDEKVCKVIRKLMESWKTKLYIKGEKLDFV